MKYTPGCVFPALCWQALPWSWMERWGHVPMSLPRTLCPVSQLQPSCTLSWSFEVRMCPPAPLPALLWGGNTYEQKGPNSWQQSYFQSPPRDLPKPTCRDLDLVLITETFACLATREVDTHCPQPLVTDHRGPCKSQPLLLPTPGNKAKCRGFLILCLDLSRLNIAAWDTKAKTERLFAFHCNMEMFSGRLKSQSLQTLQAALLEMTRSPPSFMSPYKPKDKKTSN